LRISAAADAPALVDLWHDDAAGPQFALTGKFEDGNYGLQGGIVADISGDPSVVFDTAFAWWKPIDVLKISVGSGFGGLPYVYDWPVADAKGAQVLVDPIEGLTFGAFLSGEMIPWGVGGSPNTNGKAWTGERWIQESAIGVKYKSDLFAAHIGYKLDSAADIAGAFDPFSFATNNPTFSSALTPTPSDRQQYLSFGFELTAIDGLVIDVAGFAENLGDWRAYGEEVGPYLSVLGTGHGHIIEKVAFTADAFNVYALFVEDFYSGKIKEVAGAFDDTGLPLGLNVEVGLGYKLNDTYKANFAFGANNWIAPDEELIYGEKGTGFQNNEIWFKPSLDITVGAHAAITVYYKGTLSKGWIFEDAAGDKTDYGFANLFQINFGWSF
jgi:hypothetical protein